MYLFRMKIYSQFPRIIFLIKIRFFLFNLHYFPFKRNLHYFFFNFCYCYCIFLTSGNTKDKCYFILLFFQDYFVYCVYFIMFGRWQFFFRLFVVVLTRFTLTYERECLKKLWDMSVNFKSEMRIINIIIPYDLFSTQKQVRVWKMLLFLGKKLRICSWDMFLIKNFWVKYLKKNHLNGNIFWDNRTSDIHLKQTVWIKFIWKKSLKWKYYS